MQIALYVLYLVLTLVGAVFWDWLGVTRAAAYYSDLDFQYWPVPKWRLAVLTATALYMFVMLNFFNNPANPSLGLMIPAFIGLATWAALSIRDVNRQRENSSSPTDSLPS